MTARARCSALSDRNRSRPSSSSVSRMRSPFSGPCGTSCRIGAEEGWRRRLQLAAGERVVQGQMVALHPPSPPVFAAGPPEYVEEVQAGVPQELGRVALDAAQDRLVANDPLRLPGADGAEAARHQRVGGLELATVHPAARQAQPRPGNVVPVLPDVRIERKRDQRFPLRVEGLEKACRGLGHPPGRVESCVGCVGKAHPPLLTPGEIGRSISPLSAAEAWAVASGPFCTRGDVGARAHSVSAVGTPGSVPSGDRRATTALSRTMPPVPIGTGGR